MNELASHTVFQRTPWFTYDTLKDKSIPELLELIKSIAYLLWEDRLLIAKDFQNPGISSLIAFRMLADVMLKNLDKLSGDIKKFLDFVEDQTKLAVNKLHTHGSNAFIKPFMDHLYSYNGIFEIKSYLPEIQSKIRQSLKGLPHQGQLACRRSDNRFFLMLPDFISASLEIFRQLDLIEPGMDRPKGEYGLSHVTINEGMTQHQNESWLSKFIEEFGEASCVPTESHPEAYIYFKKIVPFEIKDIYQGIPKIAIQFEKVVVLAVESQVLAEWDKQGLGFTPASGREKDKETYLHHITVVEKRRTKFQPNFKSGHRLTVDEILAHLIGDGVSKQLKTILLATIKSASIQPYTCPAVAFWQPDKPPTQVESLVGKPLPEGKTEFPQTNNKPS